MSQPESPNNPDLPHSHVGVNQQNELDILYDGECPVCQFYVTRTEFEDSSLQINRIDARQALERCEAAAHEGADINQGLIVTHAGQTYHGSAALHYLALQSKRSGAFNRLTRTVFANERLSRCLYPLLRGLRNALLRLLRIAPISSTSKQHHRK